MLVVGLLMVIYLALIDWLLKSQTLLYIDTNNVAATNMFADLVVQLVVRWLTAICRFIVQLVAQMYTRLGIAGVRV